MTIELPTAIGRPATCALADVGVHRLDDLRQPNMKFAGDVASTD